MARKITELRGGGPYERLVSCLKRDYPALSTLGRFGIWSLAKLKKTFFGVGGIALLLVVGLLVAGGLVPPLRWYLVGLATLVLLACGVLLALSYARAWVNRFVSEQRKQIADIKATLAKMNVGNYAPFQEFKRQLASEDLKRFADEWAPKLELSLTIRSVAYMAHRICLAEDTCMGRLAGSIETMVLRVLVARSVKDPNLEVLEIGTLFGVGVAMIHENCRGLFNSMHFTVIDPLIGHISPNDKRPAGCLDSAIKVPATREIFVHNMQRMSIPESDYTIIQKLSTEDQAVEEASKKRYDLLIIDGDHTDSGVRHDFQNYRHLVKPGGYIIFDDYGNPNWPGLTSFVDNEVAKMPELEFVGTDVFSAVFRVIAPPGSAGE